MERYFSTGQSPQRAVAPREEEEEEGLRLAHLLHGHISLSLEGRDVTLLSLVNIFSHLAGCSTFMYRIKHCNLLSLSGHKHEGTIIVRNVGNYLPKPNSVTSLKT